MFNKKRFCNKDAMKTWLDSLKPSYVFKFNNPCHCVIALWGVECGMDKPCCDPFTICDLAQNILRNIPLPSWMRELSDEMSKYTKNTLTAEIANTLLTNIILDCDMKYYANL